MKTQRKRGNPQNLKNLADRPLEERRKIASMGAEASNKKQAENKSLRQAVAEAMQQYVTKLNGVPITGTVAVALGLLNRGMKGDPTAVKLLAELKGELTTKVEVSGSVGVHQDLTHLTPEQLADIASKLYGIKDD